MIIFEFCVFVFTAAVLIMASVKLLGAILGNSVSLPHYGYLSPSNWTFLYPSVLYQVGFWTLHSGLMTL